MDIAIVAVLSAWLGITAINQIPRERLGSGRIGKLISLPSRHDVFALVPAWSFFAPNPGRSDYYLLYRDRLCTGSLTYWKHAQLAPNRHFSQALWNPSKRMSKALDDLVQSFLEVSVDVSSPATLKLSVPYLAILNHVSALPRSPISVATQFAVMERSRESFQYECRIVVVSDFHNLREPGGEDDGPDTLTTFRVARRQTIAKERLYTPFS